MSVVMLVSLMVIEALRVAVWDKVKSIGLEGLVMCVSRSIWLFTFSESDKLTSCLYSFNNI